MLDINRVLLYANVVIIQENIDIVVQSSFITVSTYRLNTNS